MIIKLILYYEALLIIMHLLQKKLRLGDRRQVCETETS